MYAFDEVDMKILQKLQIEGRKSNAELAREIHLSESACYRRVDALEQRGVILGYHAHIDPQKVGLSVIAFVNVTLDRKRTKEVYQFEEKMREFPEVLDCLEMSGKADYLLKVVVATIPDFRDFLMEKLMQRDEVSSVESSFVLQVVKSNNALPIRIPSDDQTEAKAKATSKITTRKAARRISR
jgi:Lrp/AsnC family leucine-responsive transcriptional regulator